MRLYRHHEEHFGQSATVRDVVIGAADGLTVPFALAAGLAGAVTSSGIVVTAGFAEIAAGAIAMGLGGYLAGRADSDHYKSERARELREVHEIPDEERKEVSKIFEEYGLTGDTLKKATAALTEDRQRWVNFMMRFELGLEEPASGRALWSALTIGGSYFLGGLIPLIPYVLIADLRHALWISAAATLATLFAFGAAKGRFTGVGQLRSAIETTVVGGLAATVAFLVARAVS